MTFLLFIFVALVLICKVLGIMSEDEIEQEEIYPFFRLVLNKNAITIPLLVQKHCGYR